MSDSPPSPGSFRALYEEHSAGAQQRVLSPVAATHAARAYLPGGWPTWRLNAVLKVLAEL
jgi:hypothetical protein